MTQDQLIDLIGLLDLSEGDKSSLASVVRNAASPSDIPEEIWTLLRVSSRGTEARLRSTKRTLAAENTILRGEKKRVAAETKQTLSHIEADGISKVRELEATTLQTLDRIDNQAANTDEHTKRETEGRQHASILKRLRTKPSRHL